MFATRRLRVTALSLFAGLLLAATAPLVAADDAAVLAKQVGVSRGLCALVGDGHADRAIGLAKVTELTVFVQTVSAADLAATRKTVDAVGLLGTRVYVERTVGTRVHLADNLADAVVLSAAAAKDDALRIDAKRALRPGGRLITLGSNTTVTPKPQPQGIGEWSHPYHGPDNNTQASDTLARGPYLTQFLATPWYGPMPQVTVSSNGRLFKAFGHIAFKEREWPLLNKLICVNAHNGAILWERKLTPGFMVHRSTMIATPDTLLLGDDTSCKLIDAATGEITGEIKVPEGVADGPVWKWMALQDGVLYALVGEKELQDDTLRGTRTQSGWPWSGMGKTYARGPKDYAWGFGRTFIAIHLESRELLWSHQEKEKIDSRAVSMKDGKLYFYCHPKFLAALNQKTGQVMWSTSSQDLLNAVGDHDKAQTWRRGYSSSSYMKAGDDALFFAGPQRRRIVAASAKDGRLLWQMEDGNYQLVLRDGVVYAMGKTNQSKKLDPLTGKVLAQLQCLRGNCTRATGTVDAVFARGDQHGGTLRLSVSDDRPQRIPAMRPACQDGVIVANGLLYWGPWMCDCNHTLVGVISLGPAGGFKFDQEATDEGWLETTAGTATDSVAPFEVTNKDWPTYRANNTRSAATLAEPPVGDKVKLLWQTSASPASTPTAPVAVGGLVFVSGRDGVVKAIDVATGNERWRAFTGGLVRYPPTFAEGRVYVGSGDGYAYCLDAATGRQLWRFRAAPIERKIPVYGSLTSTWPVTSGVLVEDGVAYCAAGVVSHDGTHVYALDARTGKIKWQNHTSGRLMKGDVVAGVSVQGHMLLHDGKLYLAGGNVVSPGVYDAKTGKCLNTLTNEWQKAPRGSELFLSNGRVAVVDKMLHSPRQYIPSRYYRKYLVQASSGDVMIQGTEKAMMRVAGKRPDGKPNIVWQNSYFVETSGVVLAPNAIVVVGSIPGDADAKSPRPALMALDPSDGSAIWAQQLPTHAAPWGLAIDRDGRVIVTLIDGRVMCFGA